ncbi:MAG: serine/threonine-protein phosphatase [Spirochaetes bacterium]|nr:serine/threonine-protein phosphatase [Spirochaetota bacterium]
MHITDENHTDQYKTYIKANFLVIIGYFIVTIGTIIAGTIGLTDIPWINSVILASIVISGSVIFILLLIYKKSVNPAFLHIMFVYHYLMYFSLFSIWIYFLNDFRIYALFCSILAISIVLTYTNIIQSLILSIGTIIVYILTSYYSISVIGQNGKVVKEFFLALFFIPPGIFFSIIANQVKKKNDELKKNKKHLEDVNDKLVILNSELRRSHESAKIEMELAHGIQKSLLTEPPRTVKGWDIDFYFKPRFGLSGDFYDFYYDSGTLTGLSLSDVSGHGVASALITILAKPVFYRFFNLFKNEQLGRVIEVSNNLLWHDLNEINMFITGIFLRFNDNSVEYVNAGHPDMLIKNGKSGKVSIVSDDLQNYKAGPIGLMNSISSCISLKLSIEPGDILLLYTDCITDGMNSERSRYGHGRLMKSLEEAPDGTAHEILDFLVNHFQTFINKIDMDDDFSAILLKKVED